MAALTNYDRFKGIGDEEALEEAAARPPKPVVTRLGEASTITIGGGGWSAAPQAAAAAAPAKKKAGGIDYSKWDNIDDSESEGEENRYIDDDVFRQREAEWKAEAAAAPAAAPPRSRETVEDATLDGGVCRTAGGAAAAAWSQTAEDVVARFSVGADARGKDVRVRVSYDHEKRACLLEVDAPGASVRGFLGHDVWCEGDDRPNFKVVTRDADAKALAELDWVLEPAAAPLPAGKCVRVALKKRTFSVDVVCWWPRLFKADGAPFEEEVLDTRTLDARAKRKAKTAEVQAAWQGAHKAFLEKVKDRPGPVAIDVGEDPGARSSDS